jgi:hypothetical protein
VLHKAHNINFAMKKQLCKVLKLKMCESIQRVSSWGAWTMPFSSSVSLS